MKTSATVSPDLSGRLFGSGSRRDFLRLAAAGGAAVAIPSLVAGCKLNEITGSGSDAGTGDLLTFDFAKGDIAFLQFFYAYKQLQTDLYDRAVATIATSDLNTAEQALVGKIRGQLIVQRETLKGLLGTSNVVTITPTWPDVNFKARNDVLNLAVQFGDFAAGMWNGVAQSVISPTTVSLVLEMSTVDARQSSAIRDDGSPKSGGTSGFAPGSQDAAYRLSTVGSAIQLYIIQRLSFSNAPAEI